MTHSKKILLSILFSLAAASAAQASDYTNSGSYNGSGAALNTASNFNLRDSNNNMTMVNGQFTSSNFSSLSGGGGVQNASAGVGTGGCRVSVWTGLGDRQLAQRRDCRKQQHSDREFCPDQ